MTPREVLRKLGAAGLLGLMYPAEHGGGEADALTNLVFAEALSQSTFGGFIITVLVHTDMASPHLHHAGTRRRRRAGMPGNDGGNDDHRGRRSPSRAPAPTSPASAPRARRDGNDWVLNGTQALHHQRRARRPLLRCRQDRPGAHAMSMFGSRRERRASRWGASSKDRQALVGHRRAGVRRLPHPGREPARRGEPGFYSVMKNFQTERIALAAMAVGHCMQALALDARPRARPRRAFGATLFDKQACASVSPCSTPRFARRARSCTTAPGA